VHAPQSSLEKAPAFPGLFLFLASDTAVHGPVITRVRVVNLCSDCAAR
jgi:hypothetical protein